MPPRPGSLKSWLDRQYNDFGCAGVLTLLLLMLLGGFAITHFGGMLAICLEYGRAAYFQEGLRFASNRRGFRLTNGQTLGGPGQALVLAAYFVVMPCWTIACFLTLVAIKHLSQRIRPPNK